MSTGGSEAGLDWIIQRCTQQWRGTELIYEDALDFPARMTRAAMEAALESLRWSDDEFRGHNVANCRCPEHCTQRQK